jgi:hypothetical protein
MPMIVMLIASAVEGSWAVPLLEKKGYRLTEQDYSDFLYYVSRSFLPLPADRPGRDPPWLRPQTQ